MILADKLLRGSISPSAPISSDYSLNFIAANSANMRRTFGTPFNASNWMFSAWVKMSSLGTNQMIFSAGANIDSYSYIKIDPNGAIAYFAGTNGGIDNYLITSNGIINNTSTWYHIVVSFASSSKVFEIYCNGAPVLYSSEPSQDVWPDPDIYFNNASRIHSLGVRHRPPSSFDSYFNGKMAEVYFIDGFGLPNPHTYFGEFINSTWSKKSYDFGWYGNNGFYLQFLDNSTASALGTDTSGNNNNFGVYNISTSDRSVDAPP